MEADVAVQPGALGALVALYFLGSAAASIPMSRAVTKLGVAPVMRWSLAGTAVGVFGIGALAADWLHMLPGVAVLGVSHAGVHLAANHAIALNVRPEWQGTAFGLKQATSPVAGVMAGLALPLIGVVVGWRWAFMAAAVAAVAVWLTVSNSASHISSRPPTHDRARGWPVLLLLVASALAGAAGNSLSAFVVDYLTVTGIRDSLAGLLLATGALFSVGARIGAGFVADQTERGALTLMAALLGMGAIGLIGLSLAPVGPALVLAMFIAFVGAWGWPGLLLLSITRLTGGGTANFGVIATGPLVGSVLGPLAFGVTAEHFSYSAAWAAAGIAAGTGCCFALAGRWYVIVHRGSPPTKPEVLSA
jgi:predicted MFS family arabinose efflux permease